jgi:hypothetical protein
MQRSSQHGYQRPIACLMRIGLTLGRISPPPETGPPGQGRAQTAHPCVAYTGPHSRQLINPCVKYPV